MLFRSADRKQINIKIDQNFSPKHKVSAGYTHEVSGGADFLGWWPVQYAGETKRRPRIFTSNFTSTLSSTLLNEARFGIRRTSTQSNAAWDNSNSEVRSKVREFFIPGGKSLYGNDKLPMIFNPGSGIFLWSGDNAPFDTNPSYLGNSSPLYNYADTVRWTRGAHALRFGTEIRITRSKGYNFAPFAVPRLTGGNGGVANTSLIDATQPNGLAGLQATNAGNLRGLLYFLAGSVGSGNQGYWVDSADDVPNARWEDYVTKEKKYRDQRQNEWAGFFQDDWKITRNVSVNLGLRYEYYGVPYLKGGFTSSAVGLGNGLFGVGSAARVFDNWMTPGNTYLTGYGGTGAGLTAAANNLRCAAGVRQIGRAHV